MRWIAALAAIIVLLVGGASADDEWDAVAPGAVTYYDVQHQPIGTVPAGTRLHLSYCDTQGGESWCFGAIDGIIRLLKGSDLTVTYQGRAMSLNDARFAALAAQYDARQPAPIATAADGIMIYGDSTAKGDHGTKGSRWWELLGHSYLVWRRTDEDAASGENTKQMLARVKGDLTHRDWTTIFMDRPNSGESAEDWIANMKAAVALVDTDRWLVVPPVIDSPAGQPSRLNAAIQGVQAALLRDGFFAGHTFDGPTQAAYAAALDDDALRDENGLHFVDGGQVIQEEYIRAFLDAAGW